MRALLLVHCKAARFEEIAAMPAQPHIANWGIQTWAEGRRRPALTSRLDFFLERSASIILQGIIQSQCKRKVYEREERTIQDRSPTLAAVPNISIYSLSGSNTF